MSGYYEINFVNFYFNELILYNEAFQILLNNMSILKSNTNKTYKEKEEKKMVEDIFFTDKQGMTTKIYSSEAKNFLFEPKNIATNTCKLIDDEKIKNKKDIIIIKQRKERNKFLLRKINHISNFIEMIKYIILLNLCNNIFVNKRFSFIEYNSYNITLKIKGTGTKKIFDSLHFPIYSYPNEVYINGDKQNGVTTHSYYLNQTNNVIGLIWYNLISNCSHMFYRCFDITEIDLFNFNTSNVTTIQSMFDLCSSLTSLNLSNFDTSKVTHMNNMFNGCSSLTSIDLSNFDTSKVEWMNTMFLSCSKLTSLNLSNFNTSITTAIHRMFDGCTNLEYINIINYNENKLAYYFDIFKDVPDNIVVCINKDNIPLIYDQINNITCHIEDCSDDWKLKQNKFIEGTAQCVNSCPDSNPYEYNGQCVSHCPNGNYTDENNIVKCKCELEKCLTCPTVAYNKELCIKCNDKYYPMENDPSNLGEYINCYNETPTGYYLDTINSIYKKCYYTCETCEIKGDNEFHNCLKCNNDFNFEIHINNYINCYVNCIYYYYFDNNNYYYCTSNLTCPKEFPVLIQNKRECVFENIKDNIDIEDLIYYIKNYENNVNYKKIDKEV